MTVVLPLDREALARLPGQPRRTSPLVCLDTETTGLATAAGTMAFLVGLGWWEGDRFRQAQLILPDQPNEPAMLALIEAHIPATAWLVTYNGRGFDWPLLVTRYRMARRDPPAHAGHLDLLPFVRRVFRHRMTDARLRTVETELLGVERHEDVEGWQIPGRYLDFLRIGLVEPLIEVVRHNREDVRSLGRLLVDVEARFATGPLVGRGPGRSRRSRTGVCPGAAPRRGAGLPGRSRGRHAAGRARVRGREKTAGGCRTSQPTSAAGGGDRRRHWSRPGWTRPGRRTGSSSSGRACCGGSGGSPTRPAVWEAIGAGAGPLSAHAWIEVAKLREHRLHDLAGAFVAAERARDVIDRRRRIGRYDPALDHALAGRLERLRRRLDARAAAARPGMRPLARIVS